MFLNRRQMFGMAGRLWLAPTLSVLSLALPGGFAQTSARQTVLRQKVYLAPDDHTDYLWSGDEEQYRKAILTMIDYYLDLSDKTARAPAQFQSRWNMDGAIWMWIWERNRDSQQIARLVRRLKDGHFSMPLTFAVSTYGGQPTEAVLRGMFYAGSVERRYGLRLPMAIAMENQTLPGGLGALWAGAGARYSWRGICGCATKLLPTVFEPRPHEIYWWQGPDQSRVLMKWYSLHKQPRGVPDYHFGTYLEVENPSLSNEISLLDHDPSFNPRYPYKIVGIFGEGGDNLSTMNDRFVTAAKLLTRPDREVIVSNEVDFFRDFETHYGSTLPTESSAFGNDWDTYSASMQEVSSSVRRATEKLRGAEALETLVSLKQPEFSKQFVAERDQAWTSFGLYWEHDWTADKQELPRALRAAWQRRVANDITGYVDHLYSASSEALGHLIRRNGSAPRFFVFNPLSWQRNDVADLPYCGDEAVHVVDLATGHTVPSQFVDTSNGEGTPGRVLRILASQIPSVGYKVFEVRPGIAASVTSDVTASGDVLENSFYRVRLDGRGAVESLVSKSLGEREMAAKIDDRFLNDLGSETGTVTVKDAGPVSVTLHAAMTGALPGSTDVTVFRGLDRIAIRNEIDGNFPDVKTWAFSFNLRSPDVWHEEVGAINHARLQPEGNYAVKFSKLDWLTLNHFVSMTGDDGAGVTISNSDDAFMKLGHSDIAQGVSTLDTTTPRIDVLAGGQVDGRYLGIQNQGGDTHFVQRFALRVQDHVTAAESMRFALEDQNPLIAGAVTGGDGYPETMYSLLSCSNPNVMLWALKPAEEGIDRGIVARFWNLSPVADRYTVKLQAGIASARSVTHIETLPKAVPLAENALHVRANSWQLQTFDLSPVTHPRSTN